MASDLVVAILSVALPARAEKEITTAGTGNPTLTTGDAPDSICPYAWRLPRNEENGSYNDLVQKYNNGTGVIYRKDTFLQIAPLGFLRAGDYNYSSGSLGNLASYGRYWSSSRSSQSNAYYLRFDASSLSPQYDNSRDSRGYGLSVRCLAR